jgi:hypothetical protein
MASNRGPADHLCNRRSLAPLQIVKTVASDPTGAAIALFGWFPIAQKLVRLVSTYHFEAPVPLTKQREMIDNGLINS